MLDKGQDSRSRRAQNESVHGLRARWWADEDRCGAALFEANRRHCDARTSVSERTATIPAKSSRAKEPASALLTQNHPRRVPIIEDGESERLPDQVFAEGAQDTIDADFRHRMISEAAYHRCSVKDYTDGYDIDDWLEAEAGSLLNGDADAASRRGDGHS